MIGDIDSGMESTLIKSAHYTKLCGGIDIIEGRDSIHRDFYVPEKWAMKFNKSKNNGINLGTNTGLVENGLRADLRRIQRCWFMRSST